MKIYSDYPELKNRAFDSVEACAAEEAKVDAARQDREAAKARFNEERLEHMKRIAEATETLGQARAELKEAKEKADKTLFEAQEKMSKITDPARAKVLEAQKALDEVKHEYIKKYSKPHGVIKVTRLDPYDPAVIELLRACFGG